MGSTVIGLFRVLAQLTGLSFALALGACCAAVGADANAILPAAPHGVLWAAPLCVQVHLLPSKTRPPDVHVGMHVLCVASVLPSCLSPKFRCMMYHDRSPLDWISMSQYWALAVQQRKDPWRVPGQAWLLWVFGETGASVLWRPGSIVVLDSTLVQRMSRSVSKHLPLAAFWHTPETSHHVNIQ